MSEGIAARIKARATRQLGAANTTHELLRQSLDQLQHSAEILKVLDRVEQTLLGVNHRIDHLETQFAELDRGVEVLMASDLAIQRSLTKQSS